MAYFRACKSVTLTLFTVGFITGGVLFSVLVHVSMESVRHRIHEVGIIPTVRTTTSTTTIAATTILPTTMQTTTMPQTTMPPTVSPTTMPPTVAPTTMPPTVAPTTMPPTVAPTTMPPTTMPPTVAPTTMPPTVAPTTMPPTIAPTTMPTTVSPTITISRTTMPTTIIPTIPPTAIPPITNEQPQSGSGNDVCFGEMGPFGGSGGSEFSGHGEMNHGVITGIYVTVRLGHLQVVICIGFIRADGHEYCFGGRGDNKAGFYGPIVNIFPIKMHFQAGEYITGVEGRAGGYIDQISFITNLGRYGPFGDAGGEPFSVSFSGQKLEYITGRSEDYVDQITFHFAC